MTVDYSGRTGTQCFHPGELALSVTIRANWYSVLPSGELALSVTIGGELARRDELTLGEIGKGEMGKGESDVTGPTGLKGPQPRLQ